ncbi:MAG: TPM domain-containing protein [Clostridia bacterium]|nr:TPM domain-containing protein [Clostridia bacterium]
MKKRIFAAVLALVLCLCMAIPALAANFVPRLVDNADLLTASEEAVLLSKLDEISTRQGMDVVVVTTDTLEGKSPRAYADDFYDFNGYAYDGVLLLVSMEDRDWWISTRGYGITAFTDAGIDYLGEQFTPELSDENYARAFEIFAEKSDEFITQARSGDPFDKHNLPKEPFNVVLNLIVALVIGLVVALIATGIMRGKLKSVQAKHQAADYVRSGSMNVTQAREFFLYRNVTRTPKPKSSSTHTSSSGRSHGGGGGKF